MKGLTVWIGIFLIGLFLYMLPSLMKQYFIGGEGFTNLGDWNYTGILESPTKAMMEFIGIDRESHPLAAAGAALSDATGAKNGFAVWGYDTMDGQAGPATFSGSDASPALAQGVGVRKAGAPAVLDLEGFQAAGTAPSPAPAVAAPAPAATSPTIAPRPWYLQPTDTSDGINDTEAATIKFWLAQGGDTGLSGVFDDLLQTNKFSSQDYKELSTIMKNKTADNIFTSTTAGGTRTEDYKKLVELLQKYKEQAAATAAPSEEKPKKSKTTKCKPKSPTSVRPSVPAPAPACKNAPIEMGDYIRKDSIPCWACNLK